MDGTVDSGRGRGISCRKFLSFEGFGPSILRAESECTSRGTNQLSPKVVRMPQCSLVFCPAETHPTSSLSLEDGETSYS